MAEQTQLRETRPVDSTAERRSNTSLSENGFLSSVGATAEKNEWDELRKYLHRGPWIDIEMVVGEFENSLHDIRKGRVKGEDIEEKKTLATYLIKLSLAMIEAQASASSSLVARGGADVADYRKDASRYFHEFGRSGRNEDDLTCLSPFELGQIKNVLIPVLAQKSIADRSANAIYLARMVRPRRIHRWQEDSTTTSNVHQAVKNPCSGEQVSAELMKALASHAEIFLAADRASA